MKYRIGLDIFGGDFSPEEILKGACLAQEEFDGQIVLVGKVREIEREAVRLKINLKEKFKIVDAQETIEMAESPATSVRKKRNSSIVIGAKLLKEGKIDAFVSCGNTGAVICAATLILGLIDGVERPGISLMIPTKKGLSLLIDVGANIGPKPLHLLQYGIMASVYYSVVFNKDNPSVGLLNIGEEETKGSEFVRYTHKLFSSAALNFKGNIEAKDIFSGKCDCIVCDGFIGNIALKVSESCAETMGVFLLEAIKSSPFAKIGLFFIKGSLRKFKRKIDYAEYGGAPLLGVNGIVIIGHGRSNARAVKNAIKVASRELQIDLNTGIKKRINEVCSDNRIKEMLGTQKV